MFFPASLPLYRSEYPGIVSNIERRLRQKDESKYELFMNPFESIYGWFSMSIGVLGYLSYESVAKNSFENCASLSSEWSWPVVILFWLFSGPLCIVVWLFTIALFLSGVAFFLAVYPIPVFMWMFGFKYLLHWARVLAIIISALTPVFILAFLFYSPICKAVTKE
jgi:hypothetical protein